MKNLRVVSDKSSRRPKSNGHDDSDSDSCSYQSSADQVSELNDKFTDLQLKFNVERKTVRVLRMELLTAQDKLSKLKRIFLELNDIFAEGKANTEHIFYLLTVIGDIISDHSSLYSL